MLLVARSIPASVNVNPHDAKQLQEDPLNIRVRRRCRSKDVSKVLPIELCHTNTIARHIGHGSEYRDLSIQIPDARPLGTLPCSVPLS